MARALHYVRSLDFTPGGWDPNGPVQRVDFMGDEPIGAYEVDYVDNFDWAWPDYYETLTETTRHLAGYGTEAQQPLDPNGDPNATWHLHGDLIRSTLLTTDVVGQAVTRVTYTAFGEPVAYVSGWQVGGELPEGLPRWGYAGGWGYQSGLTDGATGSGGPTDPFGSRGLITLCGPRTDLPPITLQHVGWRWYDPALGRFVQRDPIGIGGGMNPYRYCLNDPLAMVDPEGLLSWMDVPGHNERGVKFWINEAPESVNAGLKVTAVAAAGGISLSACIAIGEGLAAGSIMGASPGGVVTVERLVRQTVGRDGGVSIIIKTKIDGVTVSIRHIVIRAGEVIHDHITHIGTYGGTRVFPPEWTNGCGR